MGTIPVIVSAGGGIPQATFTNVELLLLMNGTNASTTFTDSSDNGATMTALGNAQLTTTDPKFGTACGTFDGTLDGVRAEASANYVIPASTDGTHEVWFKTSNSAKQCFWGTTNEAGWTTDAWWWGIDSGAIVFGYNGLTTTRTHGSGYADGA